MSEKSECSDLREQIRQLDEQFEFREEAREAQKISLTGRFPHGACSVIRIARARRLREIYKTGCIVRPSLPTRWDPVEIPPEIWPNSVEEVRPRDAAAACVEIPDELLYQKHELLYSKRKRGRPRNQALRALAESQRCSIRHARRLLASGRKRERVRESPSSEEEWALQQQEKCAKLLQALEREQCINDLTYMLNLLNHWDAYNKAWEDCDYDLVARLLLSEISASARQFAQRMVANRGTAEALVICGLAFPSIGLRYPSIKLGVSHSTIYRRFCGRLKDLRDVGEILRTTALPNADASQIADVTEEIESPWSQQTTWKKTAVRNGIRRFSPENFRAVY
jgi:hypothetical protein